MLLTDDAEASQDILALYSEIDLDDLGAQITMLRRTLPVSSVSEAAQIHSTNVPKG